MQPKIIPPVSLQVSQFRYCHLEREIHRSRPGLHVACAGHEICQPDYRVKRSTFPCYGLEYVESGYGTLRLDDRIYPLQTGVLFLYGPATFHEISTDSKAPLRKYFLDFFGREATRLIGEGSVAPGMSLQMTDVESFRAILEMILTEGNRGHESATKICAGLLRILIWKTAGVRITDFPGSTPSKTFQHCRELIDGRFLEFQTLEEMARAAGVDKFYLCRLFRAHGFPSPFNYMIRKKMMYAAQLLMTEGNLVQNVAQQVGFSDPYHFSRVFKREIGQSPRAFASRRK